MSARSVINVGYQAHYLTFVFLFKYLTTTYDAFNLKSIYISEMLIAL